MVDTQNTHVHVHVYVCMVDSQKGKILFINSGIVYGVESKTHCTRVGTHMKDTMMSKVWLVGYIEGGDIMWVTYMVD